MYVDGFTLDLYCENSVNNFSDGLHEHNEFPHQYVTSNRTKAFTQAKKDGWKINTKKRTCICPKCNSIKGNSKCMN